MKNVDVVVITSTVEQYESLLSKLRESRKPVPLTSVEGREYRAVKIPFAALSLNSVRASGDVLVALIESKGKMPAAIHTINVIRQFDPRIILIVGVTTGFDGQARMGDVVVPTNIIEAESATVSPQKQFTRVYGYDTPTTQPSQRLLSAFRTFETTVAWRKSFQEVYPLPRVHFGTSITVGDEFDTRFLNNLRQMYRNLVAVDVDDPGISYVAGRVNDSSPQLLQIKTIAALLNSKSRDFVDDNSWRDRAQNIAATCAIEFLKSEEFPHGQLDNNKGNRFSIVIEGKVQQEQIEAMKAKLSELLGEAAEIRSFENE